MESRERPLEKMPIAIHSNLFRSFHKKKKVLFFLLSNSGYFRQIIVQAYVTTKGNYEISSKDRLRWIFLISFFIKISKDRKFK